MSCSGTFITRTAQHYWLFLRLNAWYTVHIAPLPNCFANRNPSLGFSGLNCIFATYLLKSASESKALSGISSGLCKPVIIWIIAWGFYLINSPDMSFFLNKSNI